MESNEPSAQQSPSGRVAASGAAASEACAAGCRVFSYRVVGRRYPMTSGPSGSVQC
jgi:hypothetical protein